MIFRPFLLDTNESNAYVLACGETRKAMLVDAGSFDVRIIDYVEEQRLDLVAIFITHGHYDHTDGLAEFVNQYPQACVYRKRASERADAAHERVVSVAHGSKISVGHLTGTVVDTSGHTVDSIGLVFPERAFTGDALFAGSVGGTASSAQAQTQIRNLQESILSLPDTTEIYPGHGPATTVYIEKRYNPFIAR